MVLWRLRPLSAGEGVKELFMNYSQHRPKVLAKCASAHAWYYFQVIMGDLWRLRIIQLLRNWGNRKSVIGSSRNFSYNIHLPPKVEGDLKIWKIRQEPKILVEDTSSIKISNTKKVPWPWGFKMKSLWNASHLPHPKCKLQVSAYVMIRHRSLLSQSAFPMGIISP